MQQGTGMHTHVHLVAEVLEIDVCIYWMDVDRLTILDTVAEYELGHESFLTLEVSDIRTPHLDSA